jgi:cell wall-associated NlpC family hydrolase
MQNASRHLLLAAGGVLCVVAVAGVVAVRLTDSSEPVSPAGFGAAPEPVESADGGFTAGRLSDPDRTVVSDSTGAVVAVFTDGARTVRLTGPQRTFAEPEHTDATVTTDAWIRLAQTEWREGEQDADWFEPWLTEALADDSPDVFGIATEYVNGAPEQLDGDGLQVAGDAKFGPPSERDRDGRAERSDFYDYLGVAWEFDEGPTGEPKPDHFQSLDCSGYLRMVFGYRLGLPMHNTNEPGPGLPRRAYAIAAYGPGVQLIENTGERSSEYELLQEGDLVFFHSDEDGPDPESIGHSGVYLGVDSNGDHRFISSRVRVNGPTMGDVGGASLLNGGGYWAEQFLTARRL